ETEQRTLAKDLARWHAEVRKLSGQIRPGEDNNPIIARLADLQERIGLVEDRGRKVRDQILGIHQQLIDEGQAAQALAIFNPLWEALAPREQARVIGLLVEGVHYDGAKGKVSITFHPTGIKTLADELASQREEQRA